jgi:hypothetical protein
MNDTYTLAYQACGHYFMTSGKMPTVEAIKAEIGIKSPTTISSAIKDWKSALAQAMADNNTPIAGIPPEISHAFTDLWQHALATATTAYQDRCTLLENKEAELSAKEQALMLECERIKQQIALTEQRCQEESLFLKQEISRLTAESTDCLSQADEYRQRATEAEKQCAVLAEQSRQEQHKLALLTTQYEREHDWSLKRIEEEKESIRQQTQQEMTRLQSESTRSKQALELIQLKYEQLAHQAKADQERIIALERSLSEEKVIQANLLLNEAKYQNELNALQERIRLLMTKSKKNNITK